MQWHEAVEIVTPHVVRITTPIGSGTGFLIARSKNGNVCGVATAAHVIDHAHYWEQPFGFSEPIRPSTCCCAIMSA